MSDQFRSDSRVPFGASGLASPGHFQRREHLFIDVQHGLSNRLRAIASAAVIAQRTGRRLVVVWCPGPHCEARVSDLLRFDGPVIETEDAADLMRARAARVYNYMEIEEGAVYEEPILAEPVPGNVYVRAAYTLTSPHADIDAEVQYLRMLRPSDAVAALVRQVPGRSDVALHVRMATGPAFDHLSYEAPSNWPAERHRELTEWRRKSDLSRFIARLDQLIAAGEVRTMFAAADLSATYAALIQRYGDRVRYLPRDLFDRSAEQIQYALADLILLTSAPRFLASTWSSFSDLAQRLGTGGRLVEKSGIDF